MSTGLTPAALRTMVYTVDLGNGHVADVEGPEGATPEQLQQAVAAQQSPAPAEQTDASAPAEAQFGDDPNRVLNRLSPDDEVQLQTLVKSGSYPNALAFLHSKGFSDTDGSLAKAVEYGRTHSGYNPDLIAQRAPAEFGDDGRSFVRGAAQGATLGLGDELHGLIAGVDSLARGDSFSQGYDRTVDADRAQLGFDEENHGIQSTLGNLAGSVLIPFGLERSGLTTSVHAVGVAARDAAIAEGLAPAVADKIAARAVAHRLATEGAAYGGVYGAASSEGSPGERLLNGATGAVGGALLGRYGLPALEKVAGGVAKGARGAWDAATGSFTRTGAERAAGDVLRGSALRPIEDVVNDIANRPEAAPGSRPTLGEVANDTGLAAMQNAHVDTTKAAGAAIGDRYAQNAMARTAYADEVLGNGNPQAIQDVAATRVGAAESATATQQADRAATAEQRLADLRTGAAADRAMADTNVETARAALGPIADRTATGQAAREAFGNAYAAARARTSEAYAHPELTTPQPVSIPKSVFEGIISTAHDFYGDGGGEMPAAMQSIINDLADDPANTRTLTNIDRRLADVAGSAQVQGKRSEAAFANRVRGTLDSYVQETAPKEYRDALANAKSVRADQGRVFETGDAPKAFALDKFRNPVVGDTTVPTRLVRPGAPGGDTADGLIAAVGPDVAEQTVRQELRRAVDEGGVTTEAQARSLATRYGEVAKRFPAVRADLDALIGHTGRLDAAVSAQRDAERATTTAAEKAHIDELSAAETAIKASPLSRVADASVDPASFVGKLLGRSDGGRMLAHLAREVSNNPDAVAGLRRSFGQYLVEQGTKTGARNTAAGDVIPALAATRKAVSTIVTRAGDLLTSQQKIALQRVSRELKATNFALNAGRPGGSTTSQNESHKTALHFASFAVPHAGTVKAVLSVVASAMTNKAQVQHLLTQAILDPDFAATLLKRPTAAHLDAARARLLGRKALISSTLIAQTPEQETVRKVAN